MQASYVLCTLLCTSVFLSVLSVKPVEANEDAMQACLVAELNQGDDSRSIADIKAACVKRLAPSANTSNVAPAALSRFSKVKALAESAPEYEPFSLIPHRINYMLPVYITSQINDTAYRDVDIWEGELSDVESKYQLSLKVPLQHNIMRDGDGLYFGFTVEAWWQTYSKDISRPFRETNYRPEVFYKLPLDMKPKGHTSHVNLGFEHQSNGRDQRLSRSWNRLFAEFVFTKDKHLLFVRPWYRLPEKAKEFEGDPEGDDNPDILDFMGHFEAGGAYRWPLREYEMNYTVRQNVSTGKGAVEMGFSFPLWGKVRGYGTVFHGYGDSLIDYNHSQTRVGLGFALNDFF